jgi:fructosamine-3-kinase
MFNESIHKAIQEEMALKLSAKIEIKDAKKLNISALNECWELETNAGNWFLKLNDARKYPRIFESEMDGLAALSQLGHVDVARPICCGETSDKSFLITEYLESSSAAGDFWEQFAVSVARMHQKTQNHFGWSQPNYVGSLLQYNTPYQSWSVFYALNRILPLAQKAYDLHLLDAGLVKRLEFFCKRLPDLFPEEAPAFLHGDLWSGNFMVGPQGKAVLIDPAIYYGHREMDIAMTRLFGGFDNRFFYTYQAVKPLEKGWQQRIPYCQLYPRLVHLILFQTAPYRTEIEETMEEFA